MTSLIRSSGSQTVSVVLPIVMLVKLCGEDEMRIANAIYSLLIRTGSPRSWVSNIMGFRNLHLFPGTRWRRRYAC
jgi:hypothetical protein